MDKSNIESFANIIAKEVASVISTQTAAGRWLKIPQACSYAKMSKNTLMECIFCGDIKATKRKKGGWVVDRYSIDEYNGHNDEENLYNDIAGRITL